MDGQDFIEIAPDLFIHRVTREELEDALLTRLYASGKYKPVNPAHFKYLPKGVKNDLRPAH